MVCEVAGHPIDAQKEAVVCAVDEIITGDAGSAPHVAGSISREVPDLVSVFVEAEITLRALAVAAPLAEVYPPIKGGDGNLKPLLGQMMGPELFAGLSVEGRQLPRVRGSKYPITSEGRGGNLKDPAVHLSIPDRISCHLVQGPEGAVVCEDVYLTRSNYGGDVDPLEIDGPQNVGIGRQIVGGQARVRLVPLERGPIRRASQADDQRDRDKRAYEKFCVLSTHNDRDLKKYFGVLFKQINLRIGRVI